MEQGLCGRTTWNLLRQPCHQHQSRNCLLQPPQLILAALQTHAMGKPQTTIRNMTRTIVNLGWVGFVFEDALQGHRTVLL